MLSKTGSANILEYKRLCAAGQQSPRTGIEIPRPCADAEIPAIIEGERFPAIVQ
jgi:hypothetical protein